MNPAFRLEDCPQTAYITNTNLFALKRKLLASRDDHCYPNTFKTFLIPITKNLKL